MSNHWSRPWGIYFQIRRAIYPVDWLCWSVISNLVIYSLISIWLGESFVNILMDWLVHSFSHPLIDWLIGSFIHLINLSIERLIDWFIDWLTQSSIHLFIRLLLYFVFWYVITGCFSRLLGQCSQYFDLRCRLLENLSGECLSWKFTCADSKHTRD